MRNVATVEAKRDAKRSDENPTMPLSFKEKQQLLFQRQKHLRYNITLAEAVFKDKLDELEIKYIFQKGFIQGDNFIIVDFYLPKPYKLCIEIDGNYHFLKEQKERDRNRDAYMKRRKFKVWHLSNDDAMSISAEEIKDKIKNKERGIEP